MDELSDKVSTTSVPIFTVTFVEIFLIHGGVGRWVTIVMKRANTIPSTLHTNSIRNPKIN